jgi:hypothetical protein
VYKVANSEKIWPQAVNGHSVLELQGSLEAQALHCAQLHSETPSLHPMTGYVAIRDDEHNVGKLAVGHMRQSQNAHIYPTVVDSNTLLQV